MLSQRLGTLFALLLGMLLTLGLAPAAALSPAGSTTPVPLAQSGGESVKGTLTNTDFDKAPVAGARITAVKADGTFSAETVTADDGTWQIDLPGPGEYTVELDLSTLAEGVTVTNAERNPLTFEMRVGQSRTIIFPIGAGENTGRPFVERLMSKTLDGLLFGLIIAMTAIGLSLIFGTTGLVNFAHGELVSAGAIFAWWLNSPNHLFFGLWIVPAAVIAMGVGALAGAGLEKGLWSPLRKRRTGLIQMLVISIGLSLLLRNILLLMFGGDRRPLFDYTVQTGIDIGPFSLTPRDMFVMVIAIVSLVAVATMLQRTRIGKAMRAVSDNRDLAESSGIDVQKVVLFVWMLGGGLAALGGVLFGLDQTVDYLMGFRLLLLMFAGIILGGLGTAYGAMLGSILVGLITELSTLWFPAELKTAWALGALIVILLIRPQGILGQKERFG